MRAKAITRSNGMRAASDSAAAEASVVDLSMLRELVGFHVHMFDLVQYQRFYEKFARPGFTPAIFSTLASIRQNPGIRHGVLADALRIQRPNMTALLNALERAGYASRRPSPTDKRSTALYLTGRGERAVAKMHSSMLAFDREATVGLSARERKSLLALLQKAVDGGF